MQNHDDIDSRSLALAQAVAAVIDRDPRRAGLDKARRTCARWHLQSPARATAEWIAILERDWPQVRTVLLDPGEGGRRLRQSNPFCGILSPRERWELYRQFANGHRAA